MVYVQSQDTLWLFNVATDNNQVLQVNHHKSSINGQSNIAMLNNQRVYVMASNPVRIVN